MDTVIDLAPPVSARSFLRELARKSARVLLEPSRFFRFDLPRMSLSDALAFALANAWLASVLAFFVQTIHTLLLSRLLERWMQRLVSAEDGFPVWGLGASSFLYSSGLLLLAPFLLLLQASASASLLYLFSRLLIEDRPGAPEPVSYAGALRIEAASLLAGWYSLVPVFGGIVSFIAGLVLKITGVRERFGVSGRRAAAVVLAPYALVLAAALVFALFLLVALTQIPLGDLLDLDPQQLGI